MSLWSIKELSEMLDCSPQNIYQKKAKLKKLGYIELDEEGKEKINENGYNYLLNQRKSTIQNNSSNINILNNTCLNSSENQDATMDSSIKQDFVIEFLKKQIENLQKQLESEKEEKKHWQELYIKQNEDYKKITFPIMLDTETGNQKTEEKIKKGFWARLFN
jgi:hypothetical protein